MSFTASLTEGILTSGSLTAGVLAGSHCPDSSFCRSRSRWIGRNTPFCSITPKRNTGGPVTPFLKVPTVIMQIALRPSDKILLTSTQACGSLSPLGAASIRSPHSLSCHTTPASGPTTFPNQSVKGSLGNSASKSEARVRWVSDTACFSNDWAGSLFKNSESAIRIVTAINEFIRYFRLSELGFTAECRGIRLLEMWTETLAPWEHRPSLRVLAACRAWLSKKYGIPLSPPRKTTFEREQPQHRHKATLNQATE